MIKVSDHAFCETKYLGCNVGCVLTDEGTVLIDTPALPDGARDWQAEIGQLTGKSISCTIYTHEHFDHVLGSAYLTRRIIAHQAAVAELNKLSTTLPHEINAFFPELYRMYKDTWDRTEVVLPEITFTGAMALHAGGTALELSHAGGHSAASILVYLPEDNVLFCGDVANKGMPFVTPWSDFKEWIACLRRIETMDVDVIIPGHGEVCGKEEVRRIRVYFEAMREQLGRLFKAGMPKNEALQRIQLDGYLPVPKDEAVAQRVLIDAGFMWGEVGRG